MSYLIAKGRIKCKNPFLTELHRFSCYYWFYVVLLRVQRQIKFYLQRTNMCIWVSRLKFATEL